MILLDTYELQYALILSFLSASFLRKNELFVLENASKLTNEFLYDNFNKKIVIKKSCVKFDAFSRRNGSFFLKNEALRTESVKIGLDS